MAKKVTLETLDEKLREHDKRFDKVDQKFVEVDKRFDKVGERDFKFSQRLLNVEDQVVDIKKNMVTKKEFNELTNSLDKFMKQVEQYYQEMLSLKNKVDRLEKWINLIADKVGIELET